MAGAGPGLIGTGSEAGLGAHAGGDDNAYDDGDVNGDANAAIVAAVAA